MPALKEDILATDSKIFDPKLCVSASRYSALIPITLDPVGGGSFELRFLPFDLLHLSDDKLNVHLNHNDVRTSDITTTDIQTLLLISEAEDQAAGELLQLAFEKGHKLGCVTTESISKYGKNLDPKYKRTFNDLSSSGTPIFSILQKIGSQRKSRHYVLAHTDGKSDSIHVLDIEQWNKKASSDVTELFKKYYVLKARSNFAFEAAYDLTLHAEFAKKDTIPTLIQKLGQLDFESFTVRTNELLGLLAYYHKMNESIYLWQEWKKELIDFRTSLNLGDQKVYTNHRDMLLHLSKCPGLSNTLHAKYAFQLVVMDYLFQMKEGEIQVSPDMESVLFHPFPISEMTPEFINPHKILAHNELFDSILYQIGLTQKKYFKLLKPLRTPESDSTENPYRIYRKAARTVMPIIVLYTTHIADVASPDSVLDEAFVRMHPGKEKKARKVFNNLQKIIKTAQFRTK